MSGRKYEDPFGCACERARACPRMYMRSDLPSPVVDALTYYICFSLSIKKYVVLLKNSSMFLLFINQTKRMFFGGEIVRCS